MATKVIVTNSKAIVSKYGNDAKRIDIAIKNLIKADAVRGIATQIIDLSDAAVMSGVGGVAVTKPTSPKQNKEAIDAVWAKFVPDYLVLLGALDIIPHQNLANPVSGDDDETVDSDLPYASDAPYSRKVKDFLNPIRVVGRMPDCTGLADVNYFIAVLDNAAKWKSGSASDYDAPFAVTAAVWKASTNLSLKNVFGSGYKAFDSPPEGPAWTKAQLGKRSHFINCHGALSDPYYYGQKGTKYPIAHDAAYLSGKIARGTVVSAECCYGAELYNPTLIGGQAGICNTYLLEGAFGVFGSSTIAYGPASGNGAADLICQFFLRHMLSGASLGRSALQSRQDFLSKPGTFTAIDEKTVAQFSLMGDPSIHPVAAAHTAHAMQKAPAAKGMKAPIEPIIAVGNRRRTLMSRGLTMRETLQLTKPEPKSSAPSAPMKAIAQTLGLGTLFSTKYRVMPPLASLALAAKSPMAKAMGTEERVEVVIGLPLEGKGAKATKSKSGVSREVAIVARMKGDIVLSYEIFYSR